jgi:hypothetical protein
MLLFYSDGVTLVVLGSCRSNKLVLIRAARTSHHGKVEKCASIFTPPAPALQKQFRPKLRLAWCRESKGAAEPLRPRHPGQGVLVSISLFEETINSRDKADESGLTERFAAIRSVRRGAILAPSQPVGEGHAPVGAVLLTSEASRAHLRPQRALILAPQLDFRQFCSDL